MSTQDRASWSLCALQVDQDSMEQQPEKRPAARLTMTPQDVRFLKSLRIANGRYRMKRDLLFRGIGALAFLVTGTFGVSIAAAQHRWSTPIIVDTAGGPLL